MVDNSPQKQSYNVDDLLYLMARLRDPETGCPWDIEQTLTSINDSTIEEAYELVDALQQTLQGDGLADEQVMEECADVLFQVIFYAQIAKEQGQFEFADIVDALVAKLVRRHPHVFEGGDLFSVVEKKPSEAEIKQQWEAIKAQEREEKRAKGLLKEASQLSLFDDIPNALPALKRAQKIQKRASGIGFDWPDPLGASEKILEEYQELQEVLVLLKQSPDDVALKARASEELADVLFSSVNVARHLGQDAELLLEQANQKFLRRFAHIEHALAQQNQTLEAASLATLDALWEESKSAP